jgi:hypothetical protein
VGGQNYSSFALPPANRIVSHFKGGCVDRRIGLDKCGKSRHHQDGISGQSSTSEGMIKKKRGTRNKYTTKEKKMKEIREYKSIGRNERIEGENEAVVN